MRSPTRPTRQHVPPNGEGRSSYGSTDRRPHRRHTRQRCSHGLATGRDDEFSCRWPASRSGRRSHTHASQSRWEENAPRYGRMSGCDRKSGTRESYRHTDPLEAPTASCAPTRSTSRRSRTGALRCGFAVSRIRAEIPSGLTSVGPRRITRVSHSHHQLGRPSRTKRL